MDEEVMKNQERRKSRDFFSVSGVIFVLFGFVVVVAFVCLLAYFILLCFMGGCNRDGNMGDPEVNRIGVHDVKSLNIK